jgi:hypothetical protein
VHRRAWEQLTPDQKNNYRMLLIDRSIFGSYSLK